VVFHGRLPLFRIWIREMYCGSPSVLALRDIEEINPEAFMSIALPAVTSPAISTAPIRLHGLDALRGVAAVLVVLLHAGIPYMTQPMPFLVWPARDRHPCAIVDALTWCTECFIMALFFVLAGFFSNGLLVSLGEGRFLLGRTKRLLFTQALAILAILPVCLALWSLGWVADGLYVPKNFFNEGIPPELEAELYGVAHLWFLQNLYVYCLVLCGISWLAKRKQKSELQIHPGIVSTIEIFDWISLSAWKPLLPAIPCACILFFDTRIVLGFYQSFTPILSKLAYYAICFFVGVLLHRDRDRLHQYSRFGKTYLFAAALLFTALLPMIHEHTTVALTGGRLALMAGLLSLFSWCMTFGLFAISLRTNRGYHMATRYLADASFWIYLIHLPLVALTQIAIAQQPIPTIGKFLVAGVTAIFLALMTYHVFVREKWLGEFLNGHRSRRVQRFDNVPVQQLVESPQGVHNGRLVTDPQCIEQGGTDIRRRPRTSRRIGRDVIRLSDHLTTSDSCSGKQPGIGVSPMVAAGD
jgi:glucan biosynthesis protein C